MNLPMTERTWFVHFIDRRKSNSIEVEEMEFCTDNTKENLEAAVKEARKLCEADDYEYVALDLLEEKTGRLIYVCRDPSYNHI